MNAGKLSSVNQAESAGTISARQQLLSSFRDPEYRHLFVNERLRSSVALQIRALRQAREMTQKKLGDAIDMAQTWVSKLEDPEYGKMTVATLLRLAEAFDTDLEIKFRPFSRTLTSLPTQTTEYFTVPSFDEEFGSEELSPTDLARVQNIQERLSATPERGTIDPKAYSVQPQWNQLEDVAGRKPPATATSAWKEQYGTNQGSTSSYHMAL
jgi:transcriptional regulator with XRE-family HTH domain